MHVEVSVALNFLISYLYNKLPRRRVDLFGEELEKGLKKKFEGHWYPDKPFKGSGFRCVRCNGEKVDPVLMTAARNAGLDLTEVKNYIPEELTLWIDPSEVSYRISEKSPIKILYSDRHEDEGCDASNDREVQAANHTFNPEALSFQPIVDSLSSSLTSLSLSPSSPVPPPGTWSNSVSPASLSPSLFPPPLSSSSSSSSSSSNSSSSSCPSIAPPTLLLQQTSPSSLAPPQALSPAPPTSAPPPPSTQAQVQVQAQATAPVLMGKSSVRPQFTAATFAATKFGSTKLKSQAKRPTRLSPTELGNYFRQQQRTGFAAVPATATSPQRPRSLSPRDPRLEFLIDQQQRFYPRGGPCPSQLSPQGHHSLSQTLQHQQQQQHHHHQQQQQQQQQHHHQHHQQQQQQQPHHHHQQQQMSFPPSPVSPNNNNNNNNSNNSYSLPFPPTSLSVGGGGGGSGANTPTPPQHLSPNNNNTGMAAFPEMLAPGSMHHGMHSPQGSLSPDGGQKTFMDGLQQLNNMHAAYPGHLQHLLVAN